MQQRWLGKLVLLGLLFALSSCTSNNLKDSALAEAQSKLRAEFKEEAQESLGAKQQFLSKYIEANINFTKLEVIQETQIGEMVNVEVRAYKPPGAVRLALREIIARVDEGKDTAFNATDAIPMIYQNLKIPREKTDEETIVVKSSRR